MKALSPASAKKERKNRTKRRNEKKVRSNREQSAKSFSTATATATEATKRRENVRFLSHFFPYLSILPRASTSLALSFCGGHRPRNRSKLRRDGQKQKGSKQPLTSFSSLTTTDFASLCFFLFFFFSKQQQNTSPRCRSWRRGSMAPNQGPEGTRPRRRRYVFFQRLNGLK